MSKEYSTEEERREAAQLAGERSDEGQEASLREEAHHHRKTAYVPGGEAKGGQGGEPSKGDTTADIAQKDRETYGVKDTTKLDAVRCAAAWLSRGR